MRTIVQEQKNLGELESARVLLGEASRATYICNSEPGFAPPRESGLEKELRHQRELMQEGFKQMNKRFEAVDKRFEELRSDMNTHFTFMQWVILSGFGLLAFLMSFYKFFPI